ncbi:MAG TPA: TIGR02391 family protein [Pseudonocardiaceae bacterium]|nr:TIGR02391 family protein [Pseudonocardiaceae bacterium]
MPEPDYDWINQQLDLFIRQTVPHNMSGNGVITTRSGPAASDEEVITQAEIVEPILDKFYAEWRTAIDTSKNYRWRQHREAAQRCRVRLARQEEVRQKLGDNSPRLAADTLHPWVWDAAAGPWKSGNYSDAVDAAARNVNANLRRKVKRPDLSEGDLVAQAFSLAAPTAEQRRLRVPLGSVSEKTLKSVHAGIIEYGKGCFSVIRNPVAHESEDDYSVTEHEALESLTAFSLLARWVDRAQVIDN